MQSICVFLGATPGNNPLFTHAAITLGRELAARKMTLVYGGSENGLMGQLANSVLEHGGKVIGVMARSLLHKEKLHPSLTQMHLTDTIQARKQLLAKLADAFIAMPGGIGTLEEIFEVWNAVKVGQYQKLLGFLNVDGYFDQLKYFMWHTVDQGLVKPHEFSLANFEPNSPILLDKMLTQSTTTIE